MSILKKKHMVLLCAAIILLSAGRSLGETDDKTGPMLPEGLVIEEAYTPGIGSPVGKALLVQGKVVTIHADETKGFYAQNGQALFKGDKIVTLEKGRIRLKLNDASVITLASETQIVINKSVYDPEKKTRSSFIGMDTGKARFLIKKMVDMKQDEFNVKTRTAVAGVRGSEFIIYATDQMTEIIALEDTKLEVIGLALPCKGFKGFPLPPECKVKPLVLKDFEKTIVMLGDIPTEVEVVRPVEVEKIEQDFEVTPDVPVLESGLEIHPGEAAPKEEGEAVVEEAAGIKLQEFGPIMVPEQELVDPEPLAEAMDTIMPPPVFEFFEINPPPIPSEAIIEEEFKGNLPDFPGLPE